MIDRRMRCLVLGLALVAASLICNCALAGSVPGPAVVPPLGPPDASAQERLSGLYAKVQVALASAEHEDIPTARGQLDAIVADPLFSALTGLQQNNVLSTSATLAWQDDATAHAAELMHAAIAANGDNADDHYRLALMEFQLDAPGPASRRMAALVERWPELADRLDRSFLTALIYRGSPDNADRHALMSALFDAGWTDNGRDVADVWRELALLLLANDELLRASEVIAAIEEPMAIARIRSDLRFDALGPTVESLPSVEAAAQKEIERLQRLTGEAPVRVDLAADLGTALLVAGREHEALAVSDAMLAAIDAGEAESFESLDERVWLMNNRAIALRRMERLDDAVAAFEAGSRLDEQDAPNVSQALNLGSILCLIGRPARALQVIGPVGEMSGYGRMVQTAVRHCAALQLGDAPAAALALSYLEEHSEDSPEIVVTALLREGHLDRAATALISALDAPKTRAQALEYLQIFRAPPTLPVNVEMEANRTRLLARADVQAAVARVGRVLQHDVFEVSGI